MNVNVSDITETRKELLVTVTGEEITEAEKEILKDFMKAARVPGFRPGKAPEAVLRKRYRKEIQDELTKKVMNNVYREAVTESDLNVFNVVDLEEPGDFTPGSEANLNITVDVVPDFELPDYTTIKTERPSTDVSDEEVQEMIDNIRRQRANFEVVEREAAAGDYVKLSYKGELDGKPVSEIVPDESANKTFIGIENGWEEAGTDEAKEYGVPEIIDSVVGMKAGDTKDVEATFADDFRIEELRGKTVKYSVEVHEVRERQLPEIDEEFLKSVQAETHEDFKAQVLDNLEGRKRQEAANAERQQIIEFLNNSVEFSLPESGVERETQNVMGRIMVENMRRGIPEEEFEKNKEQLHQESQTVARRDLKTQLILSKIAREKEISVQEEDMQRALMNMAMQRRQSPDELVKELRKDRNRVLQLQRQILFNKTLDFLVEQANVAEQNA